MYDFKILKGGGGVAYSNFMWISHIIDKDSTVFGKISPLV